MDNSIPITHRSIHIGGEAFDEHIKEILAVDNQKAEQIKKRILKKGLKGKIIKKKSPTIFHEVRVGKFKDREHAIHLLNQLQKAGVEGAIVRR